jgi:hypothetical protein
MAESAHPNATPHLPSFITAPGETDVLMVIMAVVLIVVVLMFGIFFFRLHTLPERMAHKAHKIQFEIVAVLGLIALFTHMHIFWIAGLLLALIDIPDFANSLGRIAGSVERIAGVKPGEGAAGVPSDAITDMSRSYEAAGLQSGTDHGVKSIDRPATLPTRHAPASKKERGHA